MNQPGEGFQGSRTVQVEVSDEIWDQGVEPRAWRLPRQSIA